jgi:hypothetical protein
MTGDILLFAKSAILEFMRGPWGFSIFLAGCGLLMFGGFKLMKLLDNKKSYAETYHPPR